MSEGRGESGPPGGGFVFVGGALALDLVNTEMVVRGKAVDVIATVDELAAWWGAAGERYPGLGKGAPVERDAALLPATTALRGALRRVFEAVADRRDVGDEELARLNGVLRTGYQAVEVGREGVLRAVDRSREGSIEATLLPIARSALALLTGRDRARLRRCGNERCVLLFYDTTKSATRRWCSVGCMNRARSAQRYRERTRGLGAGTPRGAGA